MRFRDDFAASSVTLSDGTVITKCHQCREVWKERNERGIDGEPPCEKCWVELMPENREAEKIYNLTRNQLIMSFGGAVDVNQLAIHENMKLFKVQDKQACFKKVLHACRWWVSKINKKEES